MLSAFAVAAHESTCHWRCRCRLAESRWANSGHERPLGQRRGLPARRLLHVRGPLLAGPPAAAQVGVVHDGGPPVVGLPARDGARGRADARGARCEPRAGGLLRRQPAAQRGPHVGRTHSARLRGAPAPTRLLARPERRGHLRHAALALPERLAHLQRLVPELLLHSMRTCHFDILY